MSVFCELISFGSSATEVYNRETTGEISILISHSDRVLGEFLWSVPSRGRGSVGASTSFHRILIVTNGTLDSRCNFEVEPRTRYGPCSSSHTPVRSGLLHQGLGGQFRFSGLPPRKRSNTPTGRFAAHLIDGCPRSGDIKRFASRETVIAPSCTLRAQHFIDKHDVRGVRSRYDSTFYEPAKMFGVNRQ